MKLVHKTTYIYGDAIHNYQCICLHPISSERQICEDFKLLIEPNPQNLYARKIILTIHNIIFSILKPTKFCRLRQQVWSKFFAQKIIVASAISCAEALQLFTTKLALKTNYYNFNFQVRLFLE
jgi:hypothetical protein